MTSRRDFLGLMGAGGLAPVLLPAFADNASLPPLPTSDYDMSWIDRIRTPHKVVFDAPSVDGGGAVWRSVLLRKEYADAFGTSADDFSTVLVLRHWGVTLAMQHTFWQKEGIGQATSTKDRQGNWATRNPVGPVPDDGNPADVPYTIPGVIAAGTIVLACDLAFNRTVVTKYIADGMSRAEARQLAVADLIPGVILQPSGYFATVRAQQAGCVAFFNG